jgi:hypothetical protein
LLPILLWSPLFQPSKTFLTYPQCGVWSRSGFFLKEGLLLGSNWDCKWYIHFMDIKDGLLHFKQNWLGLINFDFTVITVIWISQIGIAKDIFTLWISKMIFPHFKQNWLGLINFDFTAVAVFWIIFCDFYINYKKLHCLLFRIAFL